MSSIFNALNIGYSGLKTSQVAIDTTGHNIANAENPDYTRQRTVIAPQTPLNTTPGDVGLGSRITEIVRIHDEFVYGRLKEASGDKEYDQFRQDKLDEISSYFPEIDKNGIYNGMQDYFNAWNDFSKNTDDSALKVNLAENTRNFASYISDTYDMVAKVQDSLDEELKLSVDEINRLGKEIADLNKQINRNEAAGNHANDLRDQRDKLELALSKLVDITVSKNDPVGNMPVDRNLYESGDAYHLNIGGAVFVDGGTYHPILFEPAGAGSRYGNIYYEQQDGKTFDISNFIHGGKVGAIFSLRGVDYDETKGKFVDGDIQKVLDQLDSFAASMMIATNNAYASHATTRMEGNFTFRASQTISEQQLPIHDGSFWVKVYDVDGNVVAQRKIDVAGDETLKEIADKFGEDKDDNADNVNGNDVDDILHAVVKEDGNGGGVFLIDLQSDFQGRGYTFAIEEDDPKHPTDFAGVLGLSRFFDGWSEKTFYKGSAKKIALANELAQNPTRIAGNTVPVAGDNQLANRMVQLQYDKVDFYMNDKTEPFTTETFDSFFRSSVTGVANITASAHTQNESSEAMLNTVVKEFDAISKVDIDEELTNLMKYQTGYSAAAKVITTVDQMIQTLLGIKQ